LYGLEPTKAQKQEEFRKRASAFFRTAATIGFPWEKTQEEKRQIVRGLLKKAGARVKPE
jgi:hypothetical protein